MQTSTFQSPFTLHVSALDGHHRVFALPKAVTLHLILKCITIKIVV
jgi:hypothetical protein